MGDTDPFAEAAAAHAADVEALDDLGSEQIRYLGNLHAVPDPITDNLDCETEVVTDADT